MTDRISLSVFFIIITYNIIDLHDASKNLQYFYNLSNLPSLIYTVTGNSARGRIIYLWDGTKVLTQDGSGNGRVYRGCFVYNLTSLGVAGVESIAHDEGRFLAVQGASGTEFIDTWHVRDYLGSVRAVYDITPDPEDVTSAGSQILEQNDYYAFGGRIDDGNQAFYQTNRYPYNGKEQLRFEGINLDPGLTDYGARYYAPAFGRWTTPDPLADKYYSISPYAFCNNNPVNFVDPDGLIPRLYIQQSGMGHAFVTTGEGSNLTIYTYGRYGAISDISGSDSGSLTPKGEGVLVRLTGENALQYMQDVQKEGKFEIYQIEEAKDKLVSAYFDNKFRNGSSPTDPTKSSFNNPNAKVIDTYSLLKNNCVTTSLGGINASYEIIKTDVVAPRALARYMNKQSEENISIVKIDDPMAFIKNLINILKYEQKD